MALRTFQKLKHFFLSLLYLHFIKTTKRQFILPDQARSQEFAMGGGGCIGGVKQN